MEVQSAVQGLAGFRGVNSKHCALAQIGVVVKIVALFLGTLNNRCRKKNRDSKREHNFGNHPDLVILQTESFNLRHPAACTLCLHIGTSSKLHIVIRCTFSDGYAQDPDDVHYLRVSDKAGSVLSHAKRRKFRASVHVHMQAHMRAIEKREQHACMCSHLFASKQASTQERDRERERARASR